LLKRDFALIEHFLNLLQSALLLQVKLLFNNVEASLEHAFNLSRVPDLNLLWLDFSVRCRDIHVELCCRFKLVFTHSGFLLPRHWNRHFLSLWLDRSLWLRAQVFILLLILYDVFRHHLLLFLLDLSPLDGSAYDLLHLGREQGVARH